MTIEPIKILFEKYNFDFIYINPKNLADLYLKFEPEEYFIDIIDDPNYLGIIKINDVIIEVFQDKTLSIDDITFKYKDIKKERSVKLSKLFD